MQVSTYASTQVCKRGIDGASSQVSNQTRRDTYTNTGTQHFSLVHKDSYIKARKLCRWTWPFAAPTTKGEQFASVLLDAHRWLSSRAQWNAKRWNAGHVNTKQMQWFPRIIFFRLLAPPYWTFNLLISFQSSFALIPHHPFCLECLIFFVFLDQQLLTGQTARAAHEEVIRFW